MAQLVAGLTHPHILPVHDSGEVDGLLFYVMPNMERRSLRERLDAERQLPLDQALRITREVACALDYAHRHQVVHRDIKPENILLDEGAAMVADCGIGGGKMPFQQRGTPAPTLGSPCKTGNLSFFLSPTSSMAKSGWGIRRFPSRRSRRRCTSVRRS